MAKGWREKYNTDGPRQGWGSGGVVGGGPHPSPLDSHLPLGLENFLLAQILAIEPLPHVLFRASDVIQDALFHACAA